MSDDRMFAQLMETQPEDGAEVPKPSRSAHAKPSKTPTATSELRLPDELENIGEAGYTSHSYRLTDAEVRWLRRFCFRLSEQMDRTVSQNELIRTLFRIADEDWRAKPGDNRLLDQLSQHKD
jgi:hypothetical protein